MVGDAGLFDALKDKADEFLQTLEEAADSGALQTFATGLAELVSGAVRGIGHLASFTGRVANRIAQDPNLGLFGLAGFLLFGTKGLIGFTAAVAFIDKSIDGLTGGDTAYKQLTREAGDLALQNVELSEKIERVQRDLERFDEGSQAYRASERQLRQLNATLDENRERWEELERIFTDSSIAESLRAGGLEGAALGNALIALGESLEDFNITLTGPGGTKPGLEGVAGAQEEYIRLLELTDAEIQKQLSDFDEIQRLYEDTRTPLEQYTAEVERLNALFARTGLVGSDLHRRALTQAREDYEATLDKIKSTTDRLSEDIGQSLVEGIVRGADQDEIWSRLIRIAEHWLIGQISGLLGIASPSRVYARFGRQMVEGMYQGVASNIGMMPLAFSGIQQPRFALAGVSPQGGAPSPGPVASGTPASTPVAEEHYHFTFQALSEGEAEAHARAFERRRRGLN